MSTLAIQNIINVSVANPPVGLADYKINNIALFTKEVPVATIPSFAVYKRASDVSADWGPTSEAYQMAVNIFSQTPNILNGDGSLIIVPMAGGDTLGAKITTMDALVFFGGILWGGYAPTNSEITTAATVVQSMDKMMMTPAYLTAETVSGGLFDLIKNATQTHSRMFLYTKTSVLAARLAAAAYLGRGMSVNFSGSNTTQTMNLKDLANVLPDDGINQTVFNTCQTLGVDVYASIAGVPKVFSNGANGYFDDVYNIIWLKYALTVAGFNALATVSTKIPQTEAGMTVLKGAYITVLEQAIANRMIAPGAWNSPELFGNPDDLKRNILERGYYVYSQPVNQQLQTDRAARKAPLIQIAIKFAGAIHSSSVLVNINA